MVFRGVILCMLAVLSTTPLRAESLQDRVIRELDAEGYTRVEVSRTLLGRLRMVATGPDSRREIVISTATGTILRDYEQRGAAQRGSERDGRGNSTREGGERSVVARGAGGSGSVLDRLFGGTMPEPEATVAVGARPISTETYSDGATATPQPPADTPAAADPDDVDAESAVPDPGTVPSDPAETPSGTPDTDVDPVDAGVTPDPPDSSAAPEDPGADPGQDSAPSEEPPSDDAADVE